MPFLWLRTVGGRYKQLSDRFVALSHSSLFSPSLLDALYYTKKKRIKQGGKGKKSEKVK
jgi:hypothetical protein